MGSVCGYYSNPGDGAIYAHAGLDMPAVPARVNTTSETVDNSPSVGNSSVCTVAEWLKDP